MLRNKKILVALVVVAFAALMLVLALLSPSNNINNIHIKVVVSPSDSLFYVDGKQAKAGTVALKKDSKHTLKATHQYFADVSTVIDPATYDTTKTVYLSPSPNSQAAVNWLLQNPEAQSQRESAAGAQAEDAQAALRKKYPFIDSLPYESIDYKVDYTPKTNGDVQFNVSLFMPPAVQPGTTEYDQQYQQFKSEADIYLQSNNVDPTKADVTYAAAAN